MRIAGVVLAAGEGRRAGGAKALLSAQGESFLARCLRLLAGAGATPVIGVLGHEAERVAAQAGAPAEAVLVANPLYRQGMLSSALCGLAEAEARGAQALLLLPVDHPLVSSTTVERVIEALRAGARIAVPSYAGKRGHPGGFAASAWPALRAASPEAGARAVLAAHPDWIVHVPGDAGCLSGIDTPEDYARAFPAEARPGP
jgi:CTP:molybdopterin cytidylyltransferase MocA